jgi:hypothetical protein
MAERLLTPDDFKKIPHLKHHAFGGMAPIMGKAGVAEHLKENLNT